MTPLERPRGPGGEETPTAAEAAAYEKFRNERLDDYKQEVRRRVLDDQAFAQVEGEPVVGQTSPLIDAAPGWRLR